MDVTTIFQLLSFVKVLNAFSPDTATSGDFANTSHCYDHQIQQALSSVLPPFDNYYNISKALFPSVDISSSYLKVWVNFIENTSSPGYSTIDYSKSVAITWSKACLYVAVKYLSLDAMTYFSLGTIWPQRRTRQLNITLPSLCDEDKERLLYFIATLEDIAVIANVSDPRLNTAECVVYGHEGDANHPLVPLEGFKSALWENCWFLVLTVVASVLAGVEMAYRMNDIRQRSKQESLRNTIIIIFIGSIVYEICLIHKICISDAGYVIAYVVLKYTFFVIFLFIVALVYCMNIDIENVLVTIPVCLSISFTLCHYVLWIILGIITEPFWAIPVALSELLIVFALYSFVYSYFKNESNNCLLATFLLFMWLCLIAFVFIIILVANSRMDNDVIYSVIQGALVLVISWWLRRHNIDLMQ